MALPEPARERPVPESFAKLPPRFRKLAELHGRRADDPNVVAFVTEELDAKVPISATDMTEAKAIKAKKEGFTLWFEHDKLNDAFPLIVKTKSSYLPYLAEISLGESWSEPLPFGLSGRMTLEEVEARLGPATRRPLFADKPDGPQQVSWECPLDPGRTRLQVRLGKKGLSLTLRIKTAAPLTSRHGVPPKPQVGVFVAWAISRRLLDSSRFLAHRELIARIERREAQGSAFVDAALPRGLWEDHLVDDEALRARAHFWFGGQAGYSDDKDMIELFGKRKGPHGHDEADIDDDTWDIVDRAAKVLDERFAPWATARLLPAGS